MFFSSQDYSSYLQVQESECGLMCLGAASQALGSAISATELRQWFGKSARGTSISELCDIASSLNLVATPVACELNQVRSLQLPAILHWDEKHFCVLLKNARKHFVVFNPVGGVQRLSYEQISKHFSGAAIQLGRAAESRMAHERPQVAWGLFLGIFKGLRRQLGLLLLLSFFLQVASLALPLMSQVAINLGAMQGNLQAVSLIAISMLTIYCANFVVDAWRARINHDIASHFHESSARHLFRHLLALPLEWFQRRRIADVISRFESVDPLRTAVSSGFATLVVDGTLGLVVALGLFFISPLLGAAVVLSVVATAAIKAIFAPTIASRTAVSAAYKVAEHAKRLETFRAVSTLKLASAEAVQERSWMEKLRRSLVSSEGTQTLASYQQAATVLSNNIGGVVVLYIGAKMIASGSLSIGGLFAFVMYRRYLADKVGAAADQISNLWSLRYHLERISEVLDSPKEKRWNDRRAMGDYITQGAISVRQLAFRHSSSDPVFLRNVEMSAEPGELVLITGPSGSGKTTLLKLVAGLVTPSSGQVFIDNVALSNMSPYQLRSALAAVMQDDELFAGSIFDNVTMFSETPSLEQAIEALQSAELWNEVKALPLGVHTPIGEGGRLLSGGQRQRILLARALYRRPKILLLDEAMANLDAHVEQRIMQYLKQHSATKLLVSHNLRLSELADRTFVLDQRGMRELGRKVTVAEAV